MTRRPSKKSGSNPNGTTTPGDIAALVAQVRKDRDKKRHKRGTK